MEVMGFYHARCRNNHDTQTTHSKPTVPTPLVR